MRLYYRHRIVETKMETLPHELKIEVFTRIKNLNTLKIFILSSKDHYKFFEQNKSEILTTVTYNEFDVKSAFECAIEERYLLGIKKYISDIDMDFRMDILIQSAIDGNLDTIQWIIEFDPNANIYEYHLDDILLYTTDGGSLDIVKYILSIVDKNFIDEFNFDEFLYECFTNDHIEIMKYIIEFYSDYIVDITDILQYVIERTYFDMDLVELINTVYTDNKRLDLDKVLYQNIIYGGFDAVKFIIKISKRKLNIKDALSQAAICGYLDIFKYIIDNCEFTASDLNETLKQSIYHDKIEVAKYIVHIAHKENMELQYGLHHCSSINELIGSDLDNE
jgi:hypothetical protein